MWLGSLLLLLTSCAVLLKIWWSRRRLRVLGSKIPGLPTLPLFGNALRFWGDPEKVFRTICEVMKQYIGGVCRVWIGPLLYVTILNLEDVECLFAKHRIINHDHYLVKFYSPVLGEGLIMARGRNWKNQKKLIAPIFQTKIINSYNEVFNKHANILVRRLKKLADGRVFDIYEVLSLCTLDMICESTMGICLNVQEENENLGKVLNRLIRITYERSIRPWLTFDSIYYLTSLGREEIRNVKILNDIGRDVISNKIKSYRGNGKENNNRSFLDHFMSLNEDEESSFSENQLRDAVNNIIFGGQETNAITMSFTLMFLALYSEIQDEVYQELKTVFGDSWERPVEPEDVKRMELLDRVVKETMRMAPPVMAITREVEEEVKLVTCSLPAGTKVMVFAYLNHRDPHYWPDPEQFDPDRFLPERSKDRHPYSYIPFGAGPRMCVGLKYAEVAMAVVLASVLKKYRVLPAISQETLLRLQIGLIARPSAGFPIKMIPR